jgi:hypothetical protein
MLSKESFKEGKFMKKLFQAADRYIKTSDWKIIAAVKFCVMAFGIIVGMFVRKEHRKPVLCGAAAVFLLTYIPLMRRMVRFIQQEWDDEDDIKRFPSASDSYEN